MNSTANSCRLPPALVPGDLVCVISPSGALRSSEQFEQGLAIWQQRGYEIRLSEGYGDRWGYLAGSDERRRAQLLAALNDADCKAILCSRGGYGGTRLLENWQWPEDTNKWLIGFSDITSLLWSLSQQGVVGVHGPVLTTLSAEPTDSVERLFALVERHQVSPLKGDGWAEWGCGGTASGLLLPGNLCVATHLLGTSAEPELKDVILAFEDVGEAPYRLDRMLTQWRSMDQSPMGKFRGVKGIALGRFSGWEPGDHRANADGRGSDARSPIGSRHTHCVKPAFWP